MGWSDRRPLTEIDYMQKKLEKWTGVAAALVTIVGLPLLLGSLWFAYRLDTVKQSGHSCFPPDS
jgi:hypothetical protein